MEVGNKKVGGSVANVTHLKCWGVGEQLSRTHKHTHTHTKYILETLHKELPNEIQGFDQRRRHYT